MRVTNHVEERMISRFGKYFEEWYQENKSKKGYARIITQEEANQFASMRYKGNNHEQKYLLIESERMIFTIKDRTITTVLEL